MFKIKYNIGTDTNKILCIQLSLNCTSIRLHVCKYYSMTITYNCISYILFKVENHDNDRMPTKFGPEMVPLFTALKLALPGIEVTYYGSEIGMDNTYVRPDQIQDPNNAGRGVVDETRDNERCPMQWDDSINAGIIFQYIFFETRRVFIVRYFNLYWLL